MSSPWDKRPPRPARRGGPPASRTSAHAPAPARPAPPGGHRDELRLYGINAVQAVFEQRPQAIRKVYLTSARLERFKPLLAWCVQQRVGYRVVAEDDLERLAASQHHEGIVADVRKAPLASLDTWLQQLPAGPALAIWLDGVGNPHNVGAILRSSAHFGVQALLLPAHTSLALSGAAARVAEGGAEHVPLVRLEQADTAIAHLHRAGFSLAATVVREGADVFASPLPARLIYVMGAEAEGMDTRLSAACDMRLSIPGTGAVESLNVAAATAVLLAQWRQRHAA